MKARRAAGDGGGATGDRVGAVPGVGEEADAGAFARPSIRAWGWGREIGRPSIVSTLNGPAGWGTARAGAAGADSLARTSAPWAAGRPALASADWSERSQPAPNPSTRPAATTPTLCRADRGG